MSDYKYFLDNGIFKFQEGKFSEALEFMNKSLDLKKDWEISYFYRAVVNQALENFDDAILDYTKAIQINEKMVDAYYNRANILLSRKDIQNPDIERAISDLEKSIELDPKFTNAYFAMGAALKKIGKYQEALVCLDKVLELQPDFVHARALKKLLLQKYIV